MKLDGLRHLHVFGQLIERQCEEKICTSYLMKYGPHRHPYRATQHRHNSCFTARLEFTSHHLKLTQIHTIHLLITKHVLFLDMTSVLYN